MRRDPIFASAIAVSVSLPGLAWAQMGAGATTTTDAVSAYNPGNAPIGYGTVSTGSGAITPSSDLNGTAKGSLGSTGVNGSVGFGTTGSTPPSPTTSSR